MFLLRCRRATLRARSTRARRDLDASCRPASSNADTGPAPVGGGRDVTGRSTLDLVASSYYPSTRTDRATHCRQCARPRTAKRPLSRRALCGDCATANMTRAAKELAEGRGPAYDEWVRASFHDAKRRMAEL